MQMMDWNNPRQRVVAGLGEPTKLGPVTVKGYGATGGGPKTSHVDVGQDPRT
jgi:hypothetical protein